MGHGDDRPQTFFFFFRLPEVLSFLFGGGGGGVHVRLVLLSR